MKDTDGPYTVWIEDCFELRHRIRTYESLVLAEKKAYRIFQTMYAEMQFGSAVHITDGRDETISVQEVQ